ncbi:MAG TPA: homocysteine S-methyltransferase family protein [Gaiellales bacterium]|nr:homocysteine S-methyltransferase family protein [Gaiellales bacterium]
MSSERLPGPLTLTDGGMETALHFHQGVDLPCFAAFPLVETEEGRESLRAYFRPYLDLARDRGLPFVLDAPTWRANADWGDELGYDAGALAAVNRRAVEFVDELRREAVRAGGPPIVTEALVGPRGDGYAPGRMMSAREAEEYHAPQLRAFADAAADQVAAMTIAHADEAVGIVRAARAVRLPVTVGFTLETDGRLPSGQPLAAAVEQVDRETDGAAERFMLNCAHPAHFAGVLAAGGAWRDRIGAVRANASMLSHAELDEAAELDEGDPDDLAVRYLALRDLLPSLEVVGGCCGTDIRHVTAICDAWLARPSSTLPRR